MIRFSAAVSALLLLGALLPAAASEAGSMVDERVRKLTRGSPWRQVAAVPVNFLTHHPQGMVKIGDALFVSSVEIKVPTKRFPQPVDGYDRDTGEGVGHLFKIDMQGNLLADLVLGEGTMYHPGGIDFDGRFIWVTLAEYRPNSRSIVYRVDPQTMRAEEVFRFGDHIGGIVHNTDDKTLHGVSWGSRRFYRWSVGADGKVTDAGRPPESLRTLNPSHYVDYQDCKYLGSRRMLCSGLAEFRVTPEAAPFRLGGLDLVDLAEGRALHQVPVPLWAPSGMDMMHNPVWIEPTASGLRGYFMPDDDRSTLYVYDVETK